MACAAHAQSSPTTPQPPAPPQLQALLAGLPTPPVTTPTPWVPFAVERAMGATCHGIGHDESGRYQYYDEQCIGKLPAHIAKAFLLIPHSHLPISLQERSAMLERRRYRAAPGLGNRPDFTAYIGRTLIRALESKDDASTTFLVNNTNCQPHATTTARYCNDLNKGWRAYRMTPDDGIVDVTDQTLPDMPALAAVDVARKAKHGGDDLHLDYSKLHQAATMRWTMEFDSDRPIPSHDPRGIGSTSYAHFGFLIWNGQRMELRDRVNKKHWPCRVLDKRLKPCSDALDTPTDPFVTQ